jgi:NmrA-like family
LSQPLALQIHQWQGFNATVDDDAKAIPVDHSNKQSIKDALATCSVDVVIYTVSSSCLGLQTRIAEAAKDAGVKLFVPSEFGGSSEGRTTFFDAKASIQSQLRALGLPYAAFYTGLYADWIWTPYVPSHLSLAFQLTVE